MGPEGGIMDECEVEGEMSGERAILRDDWRVWGETGGSEGEEREGSFRADFDIGESISREEYRLVSGPPTSDLKGVVGVDVSAWD